MNDNYSVAKVIADKKKLYFVDVDEHCKHVKKLVSWFGNESRLLQLAARDHDIGKKMKLASSLRDSSDFLEFGNKYIDLMKERIKRKTDINFDKKTVLEIVTTLCNIRGLDKKLKLKEQINKKYKEDILKINIAPFSSHARKLETDLQEKFSSEREKDREYIYQLIRYHHSFGVQDVIPLADKFGEQFISDLHCLISADHVSSAIYSKALIKESFTLGEGGFRIHDNIIDCKVKKEKSNYEVKLNQRNSKQAPINIKLKYDVFRGGDLTE
ncbi:hypothetical protein [Sporohalobacter salinus]|uniref:hypothetical protein n=1 Tax=Sporohalobacter salinus TaxID=1494606 RepID=UPI00196043C9|nr:hypothetical protein [Sporohalobacter salinus]MBM7623687.1 hypothetical protein [Sporohalobacter salinus]